MEEKTNKLIKQFIERQKKLTILRGKETILRQKGNKIENATKKGDKENN